MTSTSNGTSADDAFTVANDPVNGNTSIDVVASEVVCMRDVAKRALDSWERCFDAAAVHDTFEPHGKRAEAARTALQHLEDSQLEFKSSLVISESEPDEEWREARRFWTLNKAGEELLLKQWTNYADVIGASQTVEISVKDTLAGLATPPALKWLHSLQAALEASNCGHAYAFCALPPST